MTETKWTPGPWKIDGPDYFKNFTLTGEGETLAIAAVCNGETWKMVGKFGRHCANARLIAAAPDMAEAIRPFVMAYEKALEGHTDGFVKNRGPDHVLWGWNGQDFTIGMFEAARAALAKAEGRDND